MAIFMPVVVLNLARVDGRVAGELPAYSYSEPLYLAFVKLKRRFARFPALACSGLLIRRLRDFRGTLLWCAADQYVRVEVVRVATGLEVRGMHATQQVCRLCGRPASEAFRRHVLRKFDIAYFRCDNCGCLQSEPPYWLDEAYSTGSLADIDTGPGLRALDGQALVYVTARILGYPANASVLDVGGGNGLLCRLLRDIGFNARVLDRYAHNTLAKGFDDIGTTPDIVCSFEVVEHFPNPKDDMKAILARGAGPCIVGTQTYHNQGADWFYLASETGQHVFFYSNAGMDILARQYDYHYVRINDWHFFIRQPLRRIKSSLLWRAVSARGLRCVRCWLAFNLNYRYALRDHQSIVQSQRD
jgi:hypothetical protein